MGESCRSDAEMLLPALRALEDVLPQRKSGPGAAAVGRITRPLGFSQNKGEEEAWIKALPV